jgi:hypothetical protein
MPNLSLDRLTCPAGGPPAEARRIFQTEGAVVLKGVLPTELLQPDPEHLNEAMGLLAEVLARYGITSTAALETGKAVNELMRNRANDIPPGDRYILRGHFPLEVRLDPVLQAIPKYVHTLSVLQKLTGSEELFLHMPPMTRWVLPGNRHAGVPAHQDISYNMHLGPFCVMWVPLTEIDEYCGGMAVYPGTQGIGDVYQGPQVEVSDGWLTPVDTAGYERLVLAPLSLGDIVVIGDEIIHESIANTSERTRISIDYRIFGAHSHSTKHHLDLQTGRLNPPPEAQ